MRQIFDEEAEQHELKVNQDFEKKFNHRKQREELQRLTEKYGDEITSLPSQTRDRLGIEGSNDDDSEDTDEDDDGELLTADMDAKIMKTLALIRKKDPLVYKSDVKFFEGTLIYFDSICS